MSGRKKTEPDAEDLELWARVTDSFDWRRYDPRVLKAIPKQAPAKVEAVKKRSPHPSSQPHPSHSRASEIEPTLPLIRDTHLFSPRERRHIGKQSSFSAVLDLHNKRQAEAKLALMAFLKRSYSHDERLVLVITGKGRGGREEGHSGEQGILQRAVRLWLEERAFRDLVLGFSEAGRQHGGAGALYVRLRRNRGVRNKGR